MHQYSPSPAIRFRLTPGSFFLPNVVRAISLITALSHSRDALQLQHHHHQNLDSASSFSCPRPESPPSRRSHPRLSPHRPDRHPIIRLRTSRAVKSCIRAIRRRYLLPLVSATNPPRASTESTTHRCLVKTSARQPSTKKIPALG